MEIKTTDICDGHPSLVEIADPIFRDYGGVKSFYGKIATVRVFEDNVLVRETLETAGAGRVLVVDGGGSLGCALMGDRIAQLAWDNGWAGVVINGCIRDSQEVGRIPVGVKALNTCPKKSGKNRTGDTNIAVSFAGVIFSPGRYLYADGDGMVAADTDLLGSVPKGSSGAG